MHNAAPATQTRGQTVIDIARDADMTDTRPECYPPQLWKWVCTLSDMHLRVFTKEMCTNAQTVQEDDAEANVTRYLWGAISQLLCASRATRTDERSVWGVDIGQLPPYMVIADMRGDRAMYTSKSAHLLQLFALGDDPYVQEKLVSLINMVNSKNTSSATAIQNGLEEPYRILFAFSWPASLGSAEYAWSARVYRYSRVHNVMEDGILYLSRHSRCVLEGSSLIVPPHGVDGIASTTVRADIFKDFPKLSAIDAVDTKVLQHDIVDGYMTDKQLEAGLCNARDVSRTLGARMNMAVHIAGTLIKCRQQLNGRCNDLAAELAVALDMLQHIKQTAQSEANALSLEKEEELGKELRKCQDANATLEKENKRLTSQLRDARAQHTTLEKRAESLQAKLKAVDAKMKEQQGVVTSALKKSRSDEDRAREAVRQANDECGEMLTAVSAKRYQLEKAQETIARLETELATEEDRVLKKDTEIDNLRARVHTAEAKLDAELGEGVALRESAAKSKQEVVDWKDAYDGQKQKLKLLEEKHTLKMAELSKLNLAVRKGATSPTNGWSRMTHMLLGAARTRRFVCNALQSRATRDAVRNGTPVQLVKLLTSFADDVVSNNTCNVWCLKKRCNELEAMHPTQPTQPPLLVPSPVPSPVGGTATPVAVSPSPPMNDEEESDISFAIRAAQEALKHVEAVTSTRMKEASAATRNANHWKLRAEEAHHKMVAERDILKSLRVRVLDN